MIARCCMPNPLMKTEDSGTVFLFHALGNVKSEDRPDRGNGQNESSLGPRRVLLVEDSRQTGTISRRKTSKCNCRRYLVFGPCHGYRNVVFLGFRLDPR